MNYSQYEPIFGSWYITDEIGSGAEGCLYRIRRTDALGSEYYSALKAVTVPADESETASLMAGGMTRGEVKEYYESVLKETTHEFELLAKLKGNSNIASYEDHEVFRHEDGIGWDILIRLEELTPLVKYSLDRHLSADEVARMGADICRGLSLCGRYGIVHRDIKPDNIFISPSGSYKLGDFGIARIIEKSTAGLSRKGTYEYMAPEVYWGREYGTSVDLYSLGMVMYRYLNDGRMPFMPASPEPLHAGDRENAFVKRINGHEMTAPKNGSEELKRIVLKACAYDRADRYGSADEMLHDLEALQTEGGSGVAYAAAGSDTHSRSDEAGSGKQRSNAILALIACLLIAGAVYAAVPKAVTDIDAGEAEGGASVYIGDELAPVYAVKPDRFRDEPVSFSSGDESVFTVDEEGVIHALSTGEAVLTMSAKEYSEEAVISVLPKVTAISGIDDALSLTTGDTVTLTPALSPDEFADEPVAFTTGDASVAEVTDEGLLTAVSAGETTLTVSAGGCSFEASVSVSDPVVYYSSSGSSKKSSKKSSSGSSGGSKGYIDSSDDEHF